MQLVVIISQNSEFLLGMGTLCIVLKLNGLMKYGEMVEIRNDEWHGMAVLGRVCRH